MTLARRHRVTRKIGRADFATEVMGINEGDTYLILKPK